MNGLIIICAKYLFVVNGLLYLGVFYRTPPEDRRTLVLRTAAALLIALVLAKGGGALYNEPRPFVTQHIAPLIPHEADNGFPSDHTLLSFTLAFLLVPFCKRSGVAAVIIGTIVGVSRIAAHLHSPLDIVASIVIAGIATVGAMQIIKGKGEGR